MDSEGWSFLCGCAPRTDLVFCARERNDLAERDVAASILYVWNGRQTDPAKRWGSYKQAAKWRVQGMASVRPTGASRVVVALGTRGQYFEVETSPVARHLGVIPGLKVLVRRVTAIDDVVFAAGMGRCVIRRHDRGVWSEFGPGTTPGDRGRVVGFEGINGFSRDDIFAVGWRGEIWHWSQATWHRIDSPTNVNFNSVACDPQTNAAYAVGDNGGMVRGIGDQWEVVETGRAENLQDVAVFDGQVFAATDFGILRLDASGLIPEDRFEDGDRPGTCLHLLQAEDGVVSIGPHDLFVFSGGT
jgi:hypothetical protein